MSIALVVLMYATWSSVFSIGKIALQYSSPLFLTGFRMALAGLLILGYLLLAKRDVLKIPKKFFLSLFLLAFFSIYLTNILEFWSLQYLTAAKTCFIYSLSPFFAAFFSYLHFNEKMNRSKWIGLSIGLAGMIPVLLTQTGPEKLLSAFSVFSWPSLAMIGAALCSVYGWILLRLIVKDHAISPLTANSMSMLLGGMFALVHSFFSEKWQPFPIEQGHEGSFIQIALLMVLVFNIICYNLYGVMLKRYTATFLSFMGLLSPIFATLNGWLFLGESPSWVILLSTAIVSIGLWIVYRAELKQGYIVVTKKEQLIQD
ncbi:MAG: DMT family transporter [Anaerolineae bacterium]